MGMCSNEKGNNIRGVCEEMRLECEIRNVENNKRPKVRRRHLGMISGKSLSFTNCHIVTFYV